MHAEGRKSLRVVVRIRPPNSADGANLSCTLLTQPSPPPCNILLLPPNDKRAGKQFKLDAVCTTEATQDEVYKQAGVEELVQAAATGFHATLFAYGQTGSGKTYTMEGFSYTGGNLVVPIPNGTSPSHAPTHAAPHADFEGTPPAQLGMVPRAVSALFAALNRTSTTHRATVRVSFVQLYQEQAYDLLNPGGTLGPTPTGGPNAGGPAWGRGGAIKGPPGSNTPQLSTALRMRWTKGQDFYLENLFKVEVGTAEEAIGAFRSGVAAKVMASHRLNAASSRSHALFTLYISRHPLASPHEVITSRLALVDLAGSERASQTGATQGSLRDESVAINKSLFTLRQVILALAAQSSASAGGAGPDEGPPVVAEGPPGHIPYRDSKLTALLKNSLGGSSLTTMVACVSACDGALEETVSTLDYAAVAKRVTNMVLLNEDPRTRAIRELRAEVAFLRRQLAAFQAPGVDGLVAWPAAAGGPSAKAAPASGKGPPGVLQVQGSGASMSAGKGVQHSGASMSAGGRPFDLLSTSANIEQVKAQLVLAAEQDVDAMATKLISAVGLIQQLSTVNQGLRGAYDLTAEAGDALRVDNDQLMRENTSLRDRLAMLESMAGVSEPPNGILSPGPGPGARTPVAGRRVALNSWDQSIRGSQSQSQAGSVEGSPVMLHTASSSALVELSELRSENAVLYARLQAAERSPPLMHGGPQPGMGGHAVGPGRPAAPARGSPGGPVGVRGMGPVSPTQGSPALIMALTGRQPLPGASTGFGNGPQGGMLSFTTSNAPGNVGRPQASQHGPLLVSSPGPGPAYMRAASADVVLGLIRPLGEGGVSPVSRPRMPNQPRASDPASMGPTPTSMSVSDLRAVLVGPKVGGGAAGLPLVAQSTPEAVLAAATQRLVTRGVTEGGRLTTTGRVLPGAVARAAAITATSSLRPVSLQEVVNTTTSGTVLHLPSSNQGTVDSTGVQASGSQMVGGPGIGVQGGQEEDPAVRLAQIMAQRSTLARNRALGV